MGAPPQALNAFTYIKEFAMGLLTSTQVINDGTADRTFVYRGQIPNVKSLVSEYFEPASMATDSKITAKYENSTSPVQRSVLGTTCLLADATGVLQKVTFNTSVVHDKGHNLAEIEKIFNLHCAAIAISGFRTRFLQRMP